MMSPPINILLADDDKDDCLFFKDALEELAVPASFLTVSDGEQLMQYLETVTTNVPDVLFLDYNMPRKNGSECLTEIRQHSILKKIPVFLYSTSYDEEKVNQLYNTGANYYIRKPSDFEELKNVVQHAITLVRQNNVQPTKENFYINKVKAGL